MSGERPPRMHRRRSSISDDGDSIVVVTPPPDIDPPPRTRVQSTPQQPRHQRNASISGLPLNLAPPTTAGPYRTAYPASPFRTTFTHSRTRSFSSQFSPSLPSPLSTSTSFADQMSIRETQTLPSSQSLPSQPTLDVEANKPSQSRRHARLHSRNLSVFFPRPGAPPQHTIDEDGAQELVVPPTLGANFSFGQTPPDDDAIPTPPPMTPSSSASRRGHHHKHSVSHTFFSFLEPQSSGPRTQELHTQPTPIPVSPWMPISPFVGEAPKPEPLPQLKRVSATPFLAAAIAQFLLGGTLWVQGQQCGSLAVTALGYWAVFDAMGVAIPHLSLAVSKPYASARALPVLLFAQAVYLMFSAVYVCKEALEHLLLSASAGDGHHHHAGDEAAGIDFPVLSAAAALLTLALTALLLDNHARLVALAGNRIPPLRTLLSPSKTLAPLPEPTAPPARALSNPYAATPLVLACALLLTALVAPPVQHRVLDLGMAGVASVATFSAAYRACAVLGAVLLQTAPRRGVPGGRMEAFLRAMRDVERHPQVLHLPAPHIWQLAPAAAAAPGIGEVKEEREDALVVTLELHVRAALPDDDVLLLTRWVRERVVAALGLGGGRDAREGAAEVTVGVVRG
ncbi:hypothetical protein DFH07DRAFT_1004973 [Mycena maculata]|uniref:Uncharacterized protein n=1 Tax=Mycena maculata TaxID=230809 RepID=A0AAD7MNG3_9AGAR|nr:hypothetical protein DFH07DRAFT_1004973 [Mycena maculata]